MQLKWLEAQATVLVCFQKIAVSETQTESLIDPKSKVLKEACESTEVKEMRCIRNAFLTL